MTLTSTHSRTLAARPEVVGELVATLASDHDRLWPSAKWPTIPIAFERPLGVGVDGGHGRIRYRVTAYDPVRRLEFTFTSGMGLRGTHGFRIEPRGENRTELTHRVDARLAGWAKPLARVLRGYHDALIEDLLDQAQLATDGRVERAARWPRWLRVANRTEIALTQLLGRRGPLDRPARIAAVAVPAALAALAALHGAWAVGSSWPADSREALAQGVLSSSEGMPPDWATWAVAGLLLTGAGIVRRAAATGASKRTRVLTLGLSGVFLARALAYLPSDFAGGLETTYQRLDLDLYSPLCLMIGLGAAAVARRHRRRSAIAA